MTKTIPPLVSIALATYNGSRFLREQLDSIYAQTWPNFEVVAGDDQSVDGTAAILEEYRLSHGLRYEINEQNLGFVRNFESVFSRCSGEFIALADQDDIWLPEKLEILLNGIGEASLVYSDATLIAEDGKELPGSLIGTSGVNPVTGNAFEYFVCNACVTGCTALFHRSLLDVALPIPQCEMYHDWWLAVVASRLNGVAYLDAQLTRYRQHGANDTGVTIKTGILSRIAAQFSTETQEAKKRYYEMLLLRANFYPAISERLSLLTGDLIFLDNMRRYAESLLGQKPFLVAFIQALRYRNVLYPSAKPFEKIVYILSMLVRRCI